MSFYTASHRTLFEAFLPLVDDTNAQTAKLLELLSWSEMRSFLSIGGGKGIVEASLLQNAPHAKVWYLDPSPEQCQIFRQHMQAEQLLGRVAEVSQTTFQEYEPPRTFDRIISMYSWYFIGTDEQWLTKLLDLLNPNGTACIVLPNTASIFADFCRKLSPDARMTLVGDELIDALEEIDCTVARHSGTKWLAIKDFFDGEQLSDTSLAFAAFVAMHPIATFTAKEKECIADMLNAKQEPQGVPLSWDLILVEAATG